MSTARKSLPEVGGSAFRPNGWVPADEDARIDEQIDRETEIAVTSYAHYDDLIEHCAGNIQFKTALLNIFESYRDLQNKPQSLTENRRLHNDVWHGVEALHEAFEDVARIRVGEHVEKGRSYIYREDSE